MPVYMVYVSKGRLTEAMKGDAAQAITNAHKDLTGTHHFLAQVNFQEQAAGNVFLGGTPQEGSTIFVHGLHRMGRPAELKHRLAERIVTALSAVLSLEKRHIWVYIDEMPANQMVEYGYFLPEPGKEEEWFENIPTNDREFMWSNSQSHSDA